MLGGEHADSDGDVIDLLALLRGKNWSHARIIALGNTCAAAAAKETFAAHEREIAGAVAAALSGRTAGIGRSDLRFLADSDLI
ncbi:MAG: hypothetical protein ACLP01_12415 [Solirubrobacteraceae bacterium]